MIPRSPVRISEFRDRQYRRTGGICSTQGPRAIRGQIVDHDPGPDSIDPIQDGLCSEIAHGTRTARLALDEALPRYRMPSPPSGLRKPSHCWTGPQSDSPSGSLVEQSRTGDEIEKRRSRRAAGSSIPVEEDHDRALAEQARSNGPSALVAARIADDYRHGLDR